MKKNKSMGKMMGAALGAAVMAALLLLYAGAAPAQPKGLVTHDGAEDYCLWFSRSDDAIFKECMKEAEKSKAKLKSFHATPEEEEFCNRTTLGDFHAYEKCIRQVTSPKSREKMKEVKKKRELREIIRAVKEGKVTPQPAR